MPTEGARFLSLLVKREIRIDAYRVHSLLRL